MNTETVSKQWKGSLHLAEQDHSVHWGPSAVEEPSSWCMCEVKLKMPMSLELEYCQWSTYFSVENAGVEVKKYVWNRMQNIVKQNIM